MQKEPTLKNRMKAIITFLLVTILFWYFFYIGIKELILPITNKLNIIVFNKSSMYMFGVGLCFFSFTFFFIYSFIKGKEFNTKWSNYMLLISFLSIFILPQIISYYVHEYIEKINYIVCKDESVIEIKYTQYVFAKDEKDCKTYENNFIRKNF